MNRNKLVRLVCIVLAVVMLLGLITGALSMMVGAANSAELLKGLQALRADQAVIKSRSDKLEAQIAKNKQTTQNLIKQKADLDQQMEISRQSINNLNEQIQQYSLLIAQKQVELEESTEKEHRLQAQYKTRLRTMEESGKISYWSILFQASSFSDLLDRVDMIREIAKSDQIILDQIAEATKAVSREKEELEEQMSSLQETEKELAEKQKELEEQREQSNQLLIQMQKEAAALSEEYKAAEAEENRIREQVKQAETDYYNQLSKEQVANLSTQNAANNKVDGFIFPLAYSNGVTCAYGKRTHPIYGYQGFHYGVDLGSSNGTAIYAAKSGTVTLATYGEANGYYVSISHGDGYSTLYAHMTNYIVAKGDYVKQGQVIGYVGTSGWSTGPHLHFEVLLNGSNVNPMNYISVP